MLAMFSAAPWCMVQLAYLQAWRDKMSIGGLNAGARRADVQATNSGSRRQRRRSSVPSAVCARQYSAPRRPDQVRFCLGEC